MIRKLTQADHDRTMNLLSPEAALNLFLIGDIEQFGYESDCQDVWGDFDDQTDELRAVLLRYYGSFIPYAKGDFDAAGFAALMKDNPLMNQLSGKREVIETLLHHDLPPLTTPRHMYFAELVDGRQLDPSLDLSAVQQATVADVDRIMSLRESIAEFTIRANNREMLTQQLETNTGRTFYTEASPGGPMTACASTTAENSLSAMIVGVCTHEAHRQQGLASLCMTALCRQLLAESRTLCLFYDNPAAGAIYKRLGFHDIGLWTMMDRVR